MFVYQERHTLKGYHINRQGNGDTEYIKYSSHIADIVVIDIVELV